MPQRQPMQAPKPFRPSLRTRLHLLLLAVVATTSLLSACHHTVKPARQTLGMFPVVDGARARRITHADSVPENYRIMHEPNGAPVVITTTPIRSEERRVGNDIRHPTSRDPI